MHSSFIATFLAVLAPMVVLSSPQWHPHGPPPNPHKWHHGPPGLNPSATASISAGILPTGGFLPTGVSGPGSTGTPKKAAEKKEEAAVVPAAGATASLTSYD